MASTNVCDISLFATLAGVLADCRCSIVKIHADMPVDPAAAPIVVRRPVTLEGTDGATIDATGLGATVPLFVTEGPVAELSLKALRLQTNAGPAVVLHDGQGPQMLACKFDFHTPPAVVIATPVPRVDISWCLFEAMDTTTTAPGPVYAVELLAEAWGADSRLMRNSVHTPTCHDEKLSITEYDSLDPAAVAGVEIIFTDNTCGEDNRLNDPCVYGELGRKTGVCECEYGCGGDICADPAQPDNAHEVYICYYSPVLDKRVPLLLTPADAVSLMDHAAAETDGEVHTFRDACVDHKSIGAGVCAKYGPPEAYLCNCGPEGSYNHSISDADIQQVLSELTGVVLLQRDARVKSVEAENEAYTQEYYLNSAYIPILVLILFAYLYRQAEEWSHEYRMELQGCQ